MNPISLPAGPVLELDDNNSRLARRLGLSVRTVSRWRNGHHAIRVDVAERIADTLDTHPSMLWPDYYDVVIAPCGTKRAYDKQGCRCDDCKRWCRDRTRARTARLRASACSS